MFSFAEFHNLLKIPVLIEHFREHKQQDSNLSFYAFLKEAKLYELNNQKDKNKS